VQQRYSRRINHLAAQWALHMERYGYGRMEIPVTQAADLFLTRAGDQIISRLFTFDRHGQQVALRPEFTAPAAHAYVSQQTENNVVVRWQFSGAVFDDDHQHYSIGAELLGLAGAAADAEVMAMAVEGLDRVGAPNWEFAIGHIQLMRVLLARFGLDSRTQRFILNYLAALTNPLLGKDYILDNLDRLLLSANSANNGLAGYPSDEINTQQMLDVLLDATQRGETMGGRDRSDIVRRLLKKRQRATERDQYVAALDLLEAWAAIGGTPAEAFAQMEGLLPSDNQQAWNLFHDWQNVVALLDVYGIPPSKIRIQPALARNWDYYTGIVFELTVDGRSIGGGGRYDELARLVGGERDIPAVGFAFDADALLDSLPDFDAPPSPTLTLSPEEGAEAVAARWAHTLRGLGYCVSLLNTTGELVAQSNGKLRRGERVFENVEEINLELTR
jgi:histidyl-tRNA synthetase